MRTTHELTIRGDRPRLDRWLARVEALLRDGWQRDSVAEQRLGRPGGWAPWAVCFTCTAGPDRPAAGLWIHARSANELYVANVVPLHQPELSEDEVHRLLAEFEHEFLRPAAAETGVGVEVVPHGPTLERDLSPEAVRLLRAFSASADRAALHPADRRRWNAFLVRVHQDESLFDPARLDEWLQLQDWPEPTRGHLMAEYEAARSLLSAYDEQAERR